MIVRSVLTLLLPLIYATKTPCIPSGDETAINTALARGECSGGRTSIDAPGGKGAVVSLCPGSVHRLNSTIFFTAPRQTLTTEGNPTGRDRALLVVEGKDQAIAVQ